MSQRLALLPQSATRQGSATWLAQTDFSSGTPCRSRLRWAATEMILRQGSASSSREIAGLGQHIDKGLSMPRKPLVVCGCVAGLLILSCIGLVAHNAQGRGQQRLPQDWPLSIANVLPHGQPVIPIFESWIPNPNETILFTFGYINLNSDEALDIPVGPDNFIEPKQFNGFQPTHFDPAPKEPARFARHQSVFAVTVPKGFKGDVVWALRVRGQTYSSPARATREEYG